MDENTGETKAKAFLVVKGFTDPDLTEIRSKSPTLSRLSRQLILQIGCFARFSFEKGRCENGLFFGRVMVKRQSEMCAQSPHRSCVTITRESVLKLETAVYSLRNAPIAWWKRVVRDLTETGWVQHQLGQCTFMFMNGTELV